MNNDQIKLRKLACVNKTKRISWLIFFLLLLIGCETTKAPAPVVERNVTPGKTESMASEEQADQIYVVKRGDTFYSIALNHGIDQKELAEWNNITDPASIKPGQRINLSVPSSKLAEPALFALPQQPVMPVIDPATSISEDTASAVQEQAPHDIAIQQVKTYPKALKLPYSEENVARLRYSVNPSLTNQNTVNQTSGSSVRIEDAPVPIAFNTEAGSATDWVWPTTGTLISSFSNNAKGLKISGQTGQSIVATAAGEVVYSGDGLRGYGNLIIIKHDDALLSAYAHNSKLLVKEGETVIQGQKIAEMGDTDTDTPQLHFEIRRHGKPVDPLKFLPPDSD